MRRPAIDSYALRLTIDCRLSMVPCSPGVPADCPLAFRGAPKAGTRVCGGHGIPIHALGVCLCHVGYEGLSCTTCAAGYHLVQGLCQRSYESFVATDAFSAPGGGDPLVKVD